MKSMKNSKNLTTNLVEFKSVEEIYFPSVCIICGTETENRVKKTKYGIYIGGRDTKKDYSFIIPICEDCNSKTNLKTGIANNSGKLLLFGSFLGIILSILFYYLFYSIIFSISILSILILFTYLNYQKKIKSKINLNNYFQINLNNYSDNVELTFANKDYAEFVDKINLEKKKEADKQKEKEESLDKKDSKTEGLPKEKARIKSEDVQVEKDLSPIINPEEIEDSNSLTPEFIKDIHKSTSVLNDSYNEEKKNNEASEVNNDKVIEVYKCFMCGHKSDSKFKICDNCGTIVE